MAGESWGVLAVDLPVGSGQGGGFFFLRPSLRQIVTMPAFLVCAGVLGRSITNLETKGLATISFCSTSFSTETLNTRVDSLWFIV